MKVSLFGIKVKISSRFEQRQIINTEVNIKLYLIASLKLFCSPVLFLSARCFADNEENRLKILLLGISTTLVKNADIAYIPVKNKADSLFNSKGIMNKSILNGMELDKEFRDE